jgi:AraC family transcriptional regulator, regulatory protein of adaptative response / methylated-DNA-[protein]-cysteine methyltransferase
MVEDQRATAPLVEPVFDLGSRARAPLRLHLRGTNFQLKVWEALLRIEPGSLSTYGHIAALIGRPSAMRAVGNAVGQNPIPVLIPCHRVIRNLGEFGNYRYGSARKKAMLAWEMSRSEVEISVPQGVPSEN